MLRKNLKKKVLGLGLGLGLLFGLSGCQTDANIASSNLAKSAEMFELDRRIVLINTWTDKYLLKVEGKCSIENQGRELEVTCKTGRNSFKKHNLGLSRNVTYVSEQLESIGVSTYHYRVIFKPQTIIPDIDFTGSASDLVTNSN